MKQSTITTSIFWRHQYVVKFGDIVCQDDGEKVKLKYDWYICTVSIGSVYERFKNLLITSR